MVKLLMISAMLKPAQKIEESTLDVIGRHGVRPNDGACKNVEIKLSSCQNGPQLRVSPSRRKAATW